MIKAGKVSSNYRTTAEDRGMG